MSLFVYWSPKIFEPELCRGYYDPFANCVLRLVRAVPEEVWHACVYVCVSLSRT